MEVFKQNWVAELQKNISNTLSDISGMELTTQYVINNESGDSECFFFELAGNQVSIQNGTLDSPDMIFTLDSGVASLINSGELTTEEAFLRGLLQFDGDVAKLIDIFSKINQ